ncbi:hypothetical protein GF359_04085 [candidate division WOR-3 bacterium]|uniref:Uncharacterized protein n=1 Tax=candidate division WOR-3 bacterium TaxID=2052148 RepID=A0A9D5QCT1_UNCW3|nr:hypothetical protein [candidate division WOR-3 bacterium]MBD3364377.1 hypothetical protein [candidate division WOR-3 bacterium]
MIVCLLAGLNLFSAVEVSFPIEPSGEAYVGKYFNKAETEKELQYNIDVGIGVTLDLIDVAGQRLFVMYRDDLMSGNDFGANVTFDPRMAHFDLTAGFRFNILNKANAALYVKHDCTHNIDRPPDSNKVVFNRVTFVAGTPGAFCNKNLDYISEGQWFERLNGRLTYAWYPHDTIIDALNSTDLFHDLQLDLIFDQPIYKNVYTSTRIYTYIARFRPGWDSDTLNLEPFWEHKFAPQIGVGVLRQKAAFELYLRYWVSANFRLHSPGPWPYLGIHLRF